MFRCARRVFKIALVFRQFSPVLCLKDLQKPFHCFRWVYLSKNNYDSSPKQFYLGLRAIHFLGSVGFLLKPFFRHVPSGDQRPGNAQTAKHNKIQYKESRRSHCKRGVWRNKQRAQYGPNNQVYSTFREWLVQRIFRQQHALRTYSNPWYDFEESTCSMWTHQHSTVVYVKAPYEMTDTVITNALMQYGTVTNLRRQFHDFNEMIETGVRSILLKNI